MVSSGSGGDVLLCCDVEGNAVVVLRDGVPVGLLLACRLPNHTLFSGLRGCVCVASNPPLSLRIAIA